MSVLIETTLGDITIDLYTSVRPQTCLNFLKLAKTHYYDFSLVYNVKQNFCCQTGKSWRANHADQSFFAYTYGKKATKFQSEIDKAPRIKHSKRGLISMVVDKKGYHACQFLLTLGDDEHQMSYLDRCGHSPFGECIGADSLAVLDRINDTPKDEEDRPYDDVRIGRVHILYDPFPDPPECPQIFALPQPVPGKKLLFDYRMPKHVTGFAEDDDLEEIDDEYEEKRDANQRAAILEMVGDLPNKDITPEANVLFVCKLNPVTQDEDLEIIFSRFGEIKHCDIIRDHKTNDSLQYAFIEFERVEDCEKAYLKMDNVLIDERRIHVDFSQSVSRQWTQWRKNGKFANKEVTDSTSQYLSELDRADDPKWEEKKKSYMNSWAAKAKQENLNIKAEVNDRREREAARQRSRENEDRRSKREPDRERSRDEYDRDRARDEYDRDRPRDDYERTRRNSSSSSSSREKMGMNDRYRKGMNDRFREGGNRSSESSRSHRR